MRKLSEYILEWISSGKNSNSKLRFPFPPGKMTVDKTAKWLRELGVKEISFKEYSRKCNLPGDNVGRFVAPGELEFVCGPCLPGKSNIGTFWITVRGNTGEIENGYTQEITIWEDTGEGRFRRIGRDDIYNIDMDTSIYLLVDMVTNPKKKVEL